LQADVQWITNKETNSTRKCRVFLREEKKTWVQLARLGLQYLEALAASAVWHSPQGRFRVTPVPKESELRWRELEEDNRSPLYY
jgi:hypothetical protein